MKSCRKITTFGAQKFSKLMMKDTAKEFDAVIERCHSLFSKKMDDYGPAWRILRLPSITDQIFIKAQRIRSIQQSDCKMVDEDEAGEFVAIVNYCIIALIQIDKGISDRPDMKKEEVEILYQHFAREAKDLMMRKNHDYGEAWRDMRISSLCDIILQKLLRVKQIEDNGGATKVSEGIDANYFDMLNYAVFALIKLHEK